MPQAWLGAADHEQDREADVLDRARPGALPDYATERYR